MWKKKNPQCVKEHDYLNNSKAKLNKIYIYPILFGLDAITFHHKIPLRIRPTRFPLPPTQDQKKKVVLNPSCSSVREGKKKKGIWNLYLEIDSVDMGHIGFLRDP